MPNPEITSSDNTGEVYICFRPDIDQPLEYSRVRILDDPEAIIDVDYCKEGLLGMYFRDKRKIIGNRSAVT